MTAKLLYVKVDGWKRCSKHGSKFFFASKFVMLRVKS